MNDEYPVSGAGENLPNAVIDPQEQGNRPGATGAAGKDETFSPAMHNSMEEPAHSPDGEDAFSIDAILRENRVAKQEGEAGEPESDESAAPAKDKDAAETSANGKKKSRKKGCLTSIIWVAAIFIISIALAAGLIVSAMDYLGMGKEKLYGNRTVQIEIEKGTSMSEIGHILKENNIIISETLFKVYTKLSGVSDFQYGMHDFKTIMGYSQIVNSLQKPAKSMDIKVAIPDTSTVDDIFELLEDKGVCKEEDLRQAMEEGGFVSPLLDQAPQSDKVHYRLEGYLYPDTYLFYKNDDPKRVLQKMIDNLEDKFTPEMRAAMEQSGKTVNEVMTMASVIELESRGFYDEMPNIAAVFYNRLNDWPAGSRKLQSDPTMNYPYGDGAYNTYEIEGLPPGPLCSPTQAAIQAAITPTENFEAYFFVTDKNNQFYYSKTNGEHEQTIAKLKRNKLWR